MSSSSSFSDGDASAALVGDNNEECSLICCVPKQLAVVDLETTGLDPKTNEIVEIAIIVCDGDGRPTGERFVSLVRPSGGVDATSIHGITDEDVKGAPGFVDIAGNVVEMLSGRVVVAHNAYFDVRFLNYELTRAARDFGDLAEDERFPMFPTVCTMWSASVLGCGGRISLKNACDLIGHDIGNAHSALDDALAATALVSEIIHTARKNGTHVKKFGDPSTPDLNPEKFPALTGKTTQKSLFSCSPGYY